MGGFVPDPREIVAGDTLIAQAIQSQNFVSGTAGWQLNAAGDAELNDVTIRGELDVVNSGLGTSVIVSPTTNGIEFGTGPYAGPGTPVQHNGSIQGVAFGTSPNRFGFLQLNSPYPDSAAQAEIRMSSGNVEGTAGSSILLTDSTGNTAVQVHGTLDIQNPAFVADIANPAGGLVSGAVTTLGFSATPDTNVGPMWSAGTSIVIPAGRGGDYDVKLNLNFATNVTGVRQCRIVVNGTAYMAWNVPALTGFNTNALGVITIPDLAAGDVLTVAGFQNSGGALSLAGKNQISISRRLT